MIKLIIKRFTPNFLINIKRELFNNFKLLSNYCYDYKRYTKHSGTTKQDNQEKLIGKIIAHYHVIEKGLSYEITKPRFGLRTVLDLIDLITIYRTSGFDTEHIHYNTSISVIKKYIARHTEMSEDITVVIERFKSIDINDSPNDLGGVSLIRKADIHESIKFDFESFFNSRHSIRDFSEEEVNNELIYDAIRIAQKYPSVCNRQAARVYISEDKETANRHLSYQNGNRGFREKINRVLVVTVDLSAFENANERNQAYIDGGIYLMGLLLSLHSKGLGTVALNWSTYKEHDLAYRDFSNIRDSEIIISFIGIGHIKDDVLIPRSERTPYQEVVRTLNAR